VKKKIFFLGILLCLVFFISSIAFSLRSPFLTGIRFPLIILTALTNEVKAIIFFHRNFYLNRTLRKEIDFLKTKLNQATEEHLENLRLSSLLDFKQKSSYRLVAARVIGSSGESWSSAVMLDKGSSSGIKRGNPVITYLGLAGRVVEVHPFTSKVLLINDPDMGISALLQRCRQQGLVCGALGNLLIMKYLLPETDVKIDDTVITSGLTDSYPKGLLIGRVVEVRNDYTGLSRYALIKPVVNLFALEEVLVVIDNLNQG
jgi:rod shape-determining protein MreC